MSNVIPLPIIPRPRPVQMNPDNQEPHVYALKAITLWEGYVLKFCGAGWLVRVLEDRLWRAKARMGFSNGEQS